MGDANARLMAMGFNKLLEEFRATRQRLREKLKFVVKTLFDQEASFIMQAYNGIKENY
jgi:hypothetical protein